MIKVILSLGLTELGKQNFVMSIRTLREATGLGLKEAKDAVQAIQNTTFCRARFILFAQDVTLLEIADRSDRGRLFYVEDVQVYKEIAADLTGYVRAA